MNIKVKVMKSKIKREFRIYHLDSETKRLEKNIINVPKGQPDYDYSYVQIEKVKNLQSTESGFEDIINVDKGVVVECLFKMAELTQIEIDVIKMTFGIGMEFQMHLEEIGDVFNFTRERIRQIRERGLRKLKNFGRIKSNRQYGEYLQYNMY